MVKQPVFFNDWVDYFNSLSAAQRLNVAMYYNYVKYTAAGVPAGWLGDDVQALAARVTSENEGMGWPIAKLEAVKDQEVERALPTAELRRAAGEPEKFIGTPEQIAAAELQRKRERGEIVDVKAAFVDTWAKKIFDATKGLYGVKREEALDAVRVEALRVGSPELYNLALGEAYNLRVSAEVEAAKKTLQDTIDEVDKAREEQGLPPLEPRVVSADAQRLLDEAKRVKKEGERDIKTGQRAKDLKKAGGFTDVDEQGNSFWHPLTDRECEEQAIAEYDAAQAFKEANPTIQGVLAGLGQVWQLSGIGLDLLALASPTLATRLRKGVKVGKGITAISKMVEFKTTPEKVKAPKAAKIPVKKIKKQIAKVTKTKTIKTKKGITGLIKSVAGSPEHKYLILGNHKAAVYYSTIDEELERFGVWKEPKVQVSKQVEAAFKELGIQ